GNRRAADRILAGELLPELREVREVDPTLPLDRPNIFRLYEQNVGILTPLIADQLRDAENTFPPTWVEDAFREAVAQNRRNWRYILKILERWASEGRSDGTARRDPPGTAEQPDSYWTGRYGHLIRH
ncbi:MAG TPA: DnaD domain protein, partial [Dehalococcoidia bacterium]|nr:DnaD domain protein [Dehalococcoidia bacterium]